MIFTMTEHVSAQNTVKPITSEFPIVEENVTYKFRKYFIGD